MPWIIVAWFAIALYESASLIFLNPRTFGWGPRIWSLTPPALKPPMGLELGAIHSTASGKFRFVTPRRCVFSRRYGWFTTEVVTPFAIKGTIHWNEKGAFVEGRIAITPIIFFAYWITDWTLACLQDMGSEPHVALMMLLLGWGFVVGGYKWSRTLEIKRAMAVLEEIGQWQSASDRSWSAMSK